MKFLLISFIAILALVGIVSLLFVISRKRIENKKIFAAAKNLVKNEFLDFSLKNCSENQDEILKQRVLLYIKTMNTKEKQSLVFDPNKVIYWGRNSDFCQIYINDLAVSKVHCKIYCDNYKVYLNCISKNGYVIVKRNLFTKYQVNPGYQLQLKSKDRIIIGSCEFKVKIFLYNLNNM